MSEFSGFSPNMASNAANLPSEFLGINPVDLEASVNVQRSMADLLRGRDNLNANFVVASVVANGCRRYEDPDAVRHVNRGAALTQILLEDSVPNFAPNPGRYIADLVDLVPQPNPRRETFSAALHELAEARRSAVLSETWRLAPEETAKNEDILRKRVDEVLVKAGLSGYFDIAVERLTGAGLEEPTRELDAKYGAALVALGVGITGR